MSALYTGIFIKSGIKCCVLLGYKIFRGIIRFIPKRTADDLFDTSIVDVNTWSKFHNILLHTIKSLCVIFLYRKKAKESYIMDPFVITLNKNIYLNKINKINNKKHIYYIIKIP